MYDQAFKRQEKLNKAFNKKGDYSGKFFLIKDFSPRIGDAKNKAIFSDIPYICLNKNRFNLELSNLLTGVVVRRHITSCREINEKSVNRLFLPKEVKESLKIISLDKDNFVVKPDSQPTKMTLRSENKEDEFVDDEDDELKTVTFQNNIEYDSA